MKSLNCPLGGRLWIAWSQTIWNSSSQKGKDVLRLALFWLACKTDPKLKHCLPGSGKLLKTWSIHYLPSRAPALTKEVLKAMVGWACLRFNWSRRRRRYTCGSSLGARPSWVPLWR